MKKKTHTPYHYNCSIFHNEICIERSETLLIPRIRLYLATAADYGANQYSSLGFINMKPDVTNTLHSNGNVEK